MEDSVKQRSTLKLNNSWTLVIALVALILSVISIWMIYETSFSVTELNTTISTPLQQQSKELVRLKQYLLDVKTSQASLKAQYQADLNTLKMNAAYPENVATINARLLLNLANDRLQTDDNVTAALSLLNAANAVLKDSNTNEATVIKQSIAKNIATLEALPTIDTQALYLQLATLDSQLATLPLGKVLQTTTVSPQKIPAQTNPTWRDRLRDSWESFKSLIVIRHDDQATPELLSTNQKTNFLQNMHLLIVQTQLALLLHDDAIYHHNLAQLIQCLNRYVDVSDQQTKTFIQSLQTLDKINIHPAMPNLAENR